ncbi:serine/threonine-protein phosphatase 7 long form homolog [Arachis hypogaea]|uniref:serine/threonine-protein phosphatase 7 long form homolog n=1 Tax=Arachis hypogaea TaxID=3818 RepID=UPI003B224BB4
MRDDPKRLYRLDGLAHIAGAINEEWFCKWFMLLVLLVVLQVVYVTGFVSGFASGFPQRCISSMRRQQGMRLDESWFQETFRECPAGADEETVRRYVRAYIMMLLGIQLFVDKSGNRIHIRWLPYMARLEDMGGYSWGSAALAWLYWYMCRVVNRHVVKLASPLQLLQSWIFWRFPGFRPAGYDTFIWPLASRWSGHNPSTSEKGPRVQMWRLRIDLLQLGMSPDVLQVVHPEVLEPRHTALWRCVTKLIYFAMIKWHQIDRVLPQFGGV